MVCLPRGFGGEDLGCLHISLLKNDGWYNYNFMFSAKNARTTINDNRLCSWLPLLLLSITQYSRCIFFRYSVTHKKPLCLLCFVGHAIINNITNNTLLCLAFGRLQGWPILSRVARVIGCVYDVLSIILPQRTHPIHPLLTAPAMVNSLGLNTGPWCTPESLAVLRTVKPHGLPF